MSLLQVDLKRLIGKGKPAITKKRAHQGESDDPNGLSQSQKPVEAVSAEDALKKVESAKERYLARKTQQQQQQKHHKR
jgi:hypothetical protein